MTIEARVPDPDGSYVHYVLEREPVADPDRWMPLSWDNGSPEPYTIDLHPEEIFTGEQAVPVFRDYIINGQLPEPQLLRTIDV
ncbi:NTP pyrophosphohydrolase [Actinomyces qiguomingii]|nr:NTP pyrophosphohydrolase [Actinomyces qiguomingii]